MLSNKGQSLIGIIIVLVVVCLISGGFYYYLSKQIPEIPQITEKPAEEVVPPEEEKVPPKEERPEITCQDECSPAGSKKCSDNGYQICGNYDDDPCLEWGLITICPLNTICQNGICIQQKCIDGTLYGRCSANKPKYCDNGNLVDKASLCGCPSDYTVYDNRCLEKKLTVKKTGCFKENSCYRCLKDGVDITHACYNQQECENACSIILSAECHTNSDCDDENPNTLDFCESPSTKNAKCVNRLLNCIDLVKTGDISKNLDIIFVPDKIDEQELNNFQNKLNEHINTILSVEPFKSKKERINFYFLKVSENFGYFDGAPQEDKVKTFVQIGCGNMDEILVMMGEGAVGRAAIYGTVGGHFAVSGIENPWNTIHEFGHSFGGLIDNYVGWILFDGNPTLADPYIAPNIDVGGCPKWCESHSGVYETECTKITNEEECRHHERTYEYYPGVGYKWSCNDECKCCVWLPNPDPFFKTRCVNFRGNKNIGNNCYGNSGCYYGSNGQIAWRSTLDSGIMTDNQRRSLEFEDVSRRALEKILQEFLK